MNNPQDASDADSSAPTRRSRRRLRAEEQASTQQNHAGHASESAHGQERPQPGEPGSSAPDLPSPGHTESILQVAANPSRDRPRNPRRGFPLDLDGASRRPGSGNSGDKPSLLHTMTDSIRMLDPKTAALDARAAAPGTSHSPGQPQGTPLVSGPPRVPSLKPPAVTPPRGIRPVTGHPTTPRPDAATGPEEDFFSPRIPNTQPDPSSQAATPPPARGVESGHHGYAPTPHASPAPVNPPGHQPPPAPQPLDAAATYPAEDTLDRPPGDKTGNYPPTGSAPQQGAGTGDAAELSRSELRSAEKSAQEEVSQKAGRNLPLAILMGVVLGGMTLLALLLQPVAFLAIATFAAIWAIWELAFAVAKAKIYTPILPLVVSGIGIPVAAFAGGVSALTVAFFLACIAVVLWSALDDTARGRYDVAGSIFVVSYVPLMMGLVMLMLTSTMGPQKVITFIAVTVASDIGGYAVGRMMGRTPIAPQVSPKKTWEGLAGSMASSAIVGAVLTATLLGQPFWLGAVLGAGAAVAATVGDMSQSLIKRDVGVKDMGSGIPGHGGMMERLDSLLVVAPLAYGLFRWWIP